MAAAALLLPSMAVPESRVADRSAGRRIERNRAREFQNRHPEVLYVQVGTRASARDAGPNVAVMSNSHNVTLNATVRTLDSDAPARGNLILSAAQKGHCAGCAVHAADAAPRSRGSRARGSRCRSVVCTASTP